MLLNNSRSLFCQLIQSLRKPEFPNSKVKLLFPFFPLEWINETQLICVFLLFVYNTVWPSQVQSLSIYSDYVFILPACPSQGIQAVGTWQKLQLFYHGILENGGKSLIPLHNQIAHHYNLQYFSWTVSFHHRLIFQPHFFFSLPAQTRGLTAGRWSTLLCQSAVSSCATWLWYGWGQRWWPGGNRSTSKLFW